MSLGMCSMATARPWPGIQLAFNRFGGELCCAVRAGGLIGAIGNAPLDMRLSNRRTGLRVTAGAPMRAGAFRNEGALRRAALRLGDQDSMDRRDARLDRSVARASVVYDAEGLGAAIDQTELPSSRQIAIPSIGVGVF